MFIVLSSAPVPDVVLFALKLIFVSFVIPANADAKESIEIIVNNVVASFSDGLQERKVEKEAEVQEDEKAEAPVQKKTRATRRRKAETADSESSETAATETSAE